MSNLPTLDCPKIEAKSILGVLKKSFFVARAEDFVFKKSMNCFLSPSVKLDGVCRGAVVGGCSSSLAKCNCLSGFA